MRRAQRNQYASFQPQAYARIPIPKVDRCKIGSHWLIVQIAQKVSEDVYIVRTKWGRIDRMIHAAHLYPIEADCRGQKMVDTPQLTLIEVFRKAGGWIKQHHSLSCACKSGCDNRCRCVKANRQCTIFCHPSSICRITKFLSSEELVNDEIENLIGDPAESPNGDPSCSMSDNSDGSDDSQNENSDLAEEEKEKQPDDSTQEQCVLGRKCQMYGHPISDRCDGCQLPLHGFCATPPVNDVGQKAFCPACARKGDPAHRLAQSRKDRLSSNRSRIPSSSEIKSLRNAAARSQQKPPESPAPATNKRSSAPATNKRTTRSSVKKTPTPKKSLKRRRK